MADGKWWRYNATTRLFEYSTNGGGSFAAPELDAAVITHGSFAAARIPNLDAAKITSGTFDAARIPNLDAAKITTGTFDAARIPSLDASKIGSGVLDAARIPSLDTSKITTGTFLAARLNTTPTQLFRKLRLRTGPNSDVAATTVSLLHADEIEMNDGEKILDWNNLSAAITSSGAGGLDTGAEGASRWYEIHAIRKSSDGTKNLLLHRAKSYDLDQSNTTVAGSVGLRIAATQVALAQSFISGITGYVPFVDVTLFKTGSPTGNLWLTLEADSGGNPSGVALATSDKINVVSLSTSTIISRLIFRNPVSLTAATTYWLVMRGDFAVSAVNYVSWTVNNVSSYANGLLKYADGTPTWSSFGTYDAYFKIYVTQNESNPTMPAGYDQRCLIGHVYNDSGSNFIPFFANDKQVLRKLLDVATTASSVPSLVDASASYPPVPITITPYAWSNIVDDTLGLSLELFGSLSDFRTFITMSTVNWFTSGVQTILEEYQFFYIWRHAGTGTITFRVNDYRWN